MNCCNAKWKLFRGVSNDVLFRLYEDYEAGTLSDLSSATGVLEIRKSESSPLLLRLEEGGLGLTFGGTAGTILCSPTISQVDELRAGTIAKVQLKVRKTPSDGWLLIWDSTVEVFERIANES